MQSLLLSIGKLSTFSAEASQPEQAVLGRALHKDTARAGQQVIAEVRRQATCQCLMEALLSASKLSWKS